MLKIRNFLKQKWKLLEVEGKWVFSGSKNDRATDL